MFSEPADDVIRIVPKVSSDAASFGAGTEIPPLIERLNGNSEIR